MCWRQRRTSGRSARSGRGSGCPGSSTRTCTSCRRASRRPSGPSSTPPAPKIGREWPIRYRSRPARGPRRLLRAMGVRRFSDAALRAQARRRGVPQRLVAHLRRGGAGGALWSATFFPEDGVTGEPHRGGRRRGGGVQLAPAGGGVPTSTTRCSTTCGAVARGRLCPGAGARRAPGRSATTSPGPARCRGCSSGTRGCLIHRGAHGRAGGGRGSCGWPGGLRAGAARHHDGVHRLLRPLAPYPPSGCCPGSGRPAVAKILLGTDFPTIPYPYAHQLEGLALVRPRRRLAAGGLLGEPGGPVRAAAVSGGGRRRLAAR